MKKWTRVVFINKKVFKVYDISLGAIPSQLWQMKCPKFQNLEI